MRFALVEFCEAACCSRRLLVTKCCENTTLTQITEVTDISKVNSHISGRDFLMKMVFEVIKMQGVKMQNIQYFDLALNSSSISSRWPYGGPGLNEAIQVG